MTQAIRRIVVGVAPGEEPDPVLPPAVELARSVGAVLQVVQAYAHGDPALAAYTRKGFTPAAARDRVGAHLRNLLRERLDALNAPEGAEVYALEDEASALLVEITTLSRADLLVVGPTRRGPVARRLLGTTASHVLRASPAPVLLLLGAPLPASGARVLLGNPLGSFGSEVHRRALALVRPLVGAGRPIVRSLHVRSREDALFAAFDHGRRALEAVDEVRRFLAGRVPHGMEVIAAARFGAPDAELLAEAAAWPADLLVLGTHRRHGLPRLVLGSVSEAVLSRARCNALVIPVAAGEPHRAGDPLPPLRVAGAV